MVKNMKLRKIALLILITLFMCFVTSIFSSTYAATGSIHLGIKMLRASGYGYKALDNKSVWKICEYDSTGTVANYDKTIYCLKGGPGFGSTNFGSGTTEVKEYTRYFNMREPDTMPTTYSSVLPDITSSTYKSLIWLLDNVYVAPKSNASPTEIANADEYKQILLQKAGITDSVLTDDDIDALQQLAVWYFTNADAYKVDGTFEFQVNAVAGTDANYKPLSDDVHENGWDRAEQCQELFDYLVETATQMGSTYNINGNTANPLTLADITAKAELDGENYVVGPFKIERAGNTEYTFTAKLTNSSGGVTPIKLQNASGNEFESYEETIGSEFFIVIPNTTDLTDLKLTIDVSCFNTTLTYWSVEGADASEQPVVVVEKTKNTYARNAIVTIEEEKELDLALRKFIIAIGDETIQTREPQISATTLEALKSGDIKTAEKVHPKNALTVKTGDKVIYKIRVYNEGEVDAYVREITDYLPDGLKFVENSTLNTFYGWKVSADGKTVTTDITSPDTQYTNNQTQIYADRTEETDKVLLKAFNGTKLDYIDVEIECEVIATVSENDKVLKNIAEITEHSDSTGITTVTDRDSTPKSLTTEQKENYGTESKQDDDDFEQLVILGKYFDLSLRKFIIKVDNAELKNSQGAYEREPVVVLSPLLQGEDTATYNGPKTPVKVSIGNEVIYTIRVYNEGQIDGYVNEITDHLPPQLEFVNDEFNASYGWKISEDGRTVTTDITSPNTQYKANQSQIYADRTEGTDKVILKAFDENELDYIDVQIKCKVKSNVDAYEKITNIAEITSFTDSDGNTVTDRDSQKDNITLPQDTVLPAYKDTEINAGNAYIEGQQDDDDFEKLIIQKFDLALRKFITGVNDTRVDSRIPVFSIDENGKYVYTHTKEPVEVSNGDTVIYTLRIYNEGNQSGYAEEIKDNLPEGLEYLPNNNINVEYRWKMYKEDGTETTNLAEAVAIKTDYLSKAQEQAAGRENIIGEFNKETMETPNYKDIKVAFKVIEPNTSKRILINTAEIAEDSDEYGKSVNDIDSTPNNNNEEEDDIDIEKVKLKYFDLSLRKFITGVNDTVIDSRVPVFSKDDEGNYVYTHTKEPVEVANNDIVIYTLRIYNEGTVAGYAEEVKDNLPEGLEYLPENEVNKTYRWKMYKEDGTETTDLAEAVAIKTDYLSKLQETEAARENLINGFDMETMTQPDFKDVKVAFKVTEPNTSDRILINTAEIAEDLDKNGDPVDDIDSIPDNNIENEDDIDIEKVKVKYFDLALEKIITETILTVDGKTTVTKTGHEWGVQPEPVVKMEIREYNIKYATLKFKYQIKITNEGEIPGYATEITDYVPEGTKFEAKDNPNWKEVEEGKVTTDQLKDKLLQPGESAIVEITLTWINGQNNLGQKTNIAEISKDGNDSDSPDIDSTPNNKAPEEDDIDDASIVLSIRTGIGANYTIIITLVLATLSVGVILIKKFVL